MVERNRRMRKVACIIFLFWLPLLFTQNNGREFVLPEAQVPDSLRTIIPAWLKTIFGNSQQSPFITLIVQPNLCPRCEAYFPYIRDVISSVDTSLNKSSVLVFHSISPHAAQILAREYPYKNFENIYLDRVGIVRKIVPLGLPYCIVWDHQGRILFQAPLFGKVDIDQLKNTLQRALQRRSPLQVSAEQEQQFQRFRSLGSKLDNPQYDPVCSPALRSSAGYCKVNVQNITLPDTIPLSDEGVVAFSPTSRMLVTFNPLLLSYTTFVYPSDSRATAQLHQLYRFPKALLTRFVSLLPKDLESVERQGLLRPIPLNNHPIDDSTFAASVVFPHIQYEVSYDSAREAYDTAIASSTTYLMVIFAMRSGTLAIDTIWNLDPVDSLALRYMTSIVSVHKQSPEQTFVLLRLARGIPHKTYFYKDENFLTNRFYDSAYAFALYFPTTQQLRILPIYLPPVYRRIKIGYGPIGGAVATPISTDMYAAVYPLSPYLWIYDLSSQHTIQIPLWRRTQILQCTQRLASLLQPLQRNIQDTMEYLQQYRSLFDTITTMIQFLPAEIQKITDSIVAVRWIKLSPSSTWDKPQSDQLIWEFYNIRQKSFITDIAIDLAENNSSCSFVGFRHLDPDPWNVWYLLYRNGQHLFIDQITLNQTSAAGRHNIPDRVQKTAR